MKRLGISIYPEHASLEKIAAYIRTAASYGYQRIFTCLISLEPSNFEVFKGMIQVANEHKMDVIADVSPEVFKLLNIEITDLKYFYDLGLKGIRLDLGFTGIEESLMTCNPYGLIVEINMSNGTRYVENILSHQPVLENLYGCHNFYPHRYTGLSNEHFIQCSKQFKALNIRTAAFVNARSATFGPWPVEEGLCTLEDHRDLELAVQAKALFQTQLIDDVIIANCFASEEELKSLSLVNKEVLTLSVKPAQRLTAVEEAIIFEELHYNRGDVSAYMIRSTQSRVKYKDEYFELKHAKEIKRGDVLIDSSLYKRYAGELQIALKDMKNSGKTSVVGKISSEELFLLDQIKPWQKFKLVRS